MIQELLLLKKNIGETPLACMDRYRETHPEYQGVKMTYAGRLDPIAHGLLIVLTGAGVHKKDTYNKLDKIYRCSAILGVTTDTYDILGIPKQGTDPLLEDHDYFNDEKVSRHVIHDPSHDNSLLKITNQVQDVMDHFSGTFEQEYPPFSSKTVGGIALHERTRTNIPTILPTHQITVYENLLEKVSCINTLDLVTTIVNRIIKVQGDFRQQETVDKWNAWGQHVGEREHVLITMRLKVSSGTYIRGIVESIGKRLGCGACILDLERLQIGDMRLHTYKEL